MGRFSCSVLCQGSPPLSLPFIIMLYSLGYYLPSRFSTVLLVQCHGCWGLGQGLMAGGARGWVASRAGSRVCWLFGFGVSSSSPPCSLGTQPPYATKALTVCTIHCYKFQKKCSQLCDTDMSLSTSFSKNCFRFFTKFQLNMWIFFNTAKCNVTELITKRACISHVVGSFYIIPCARIWITRFHVSEILASGFHVFLEEENLRSPFGQQCLHYTKCAGASGFHAFFHQRRFFDSEQLCVSKLPIYPSPHSTSCPKLG